MRAKRNILPFAVILFLSAGHSDVWAAQENPVDMDRMAAGYYSEETLRRLQDNVLEYDEIPDLVHEYNRTITDIWEELRDTQRDLYKNADELRSAERKMKDQKEKAGSQGETAGMYQYAMQETILGKTASSIHSTASSLLNNSTRASVKKTENQFVQAAQSLMITYDSLNKQQAILEKLEELYESQNHLVNNMRALGMATEQEVLRAQSNQLSAQSGLASIKNAKKKIKPVLCRLTGWPADGNPEIRAIPSADMSRIEHMDLEADTKKAIGNNTTLINQRNSEKGKTYAGTEARLAVIQEGDEKLTIKMKQLYEDVRSGQDALEAAAAGYQSAQKSREGYERMYRLGMLSQAEYLGAEISYYQKKAEWENSETQLLLAVETYEWAVLGLSDIE